MEPTQAAIERFKQGYSCAQSVFSVLAERKGVDRDLAFRISAGLGGGIARTAGVCGCVTGAILALGLEQTDVSPENNKRDKEKTYELAQRFLAEFSARSGSTGCRELLGCDISTKEGLQQAREQKLFEQRCEKLVRDAVEIAIQLTGAGGRP